MSEFSWYEEAVSLREQLKEVKRDRDEATTLLSTLSGAVRTEWSTPPPAVREALAGVEKHLSRRLQTALDKQGKSGD